MTKKETFSTACILEPNKDEPIFVDIPDDINLKTFIGYEPHYTFMLPPFDNYILVYNASEKNKIEDNYNFYYFTGIYYGKVCLLKVENTNDEDKAVISTLTDDDKIELIARVYQLKHDQINDRLKNAIEKLGVDTVSSLILSESKRLIDQVEEDVNSSNAELAKESREKLIDDIKNSILSNSKDNILTKYDENEKVDDNNGKKEE